MRHHGTIEIDRPVRVVYDQWTQFETFPEFMSGVDEVRQLDDTHNHWKVTIAGVEREFDTEITDQTPDSHIAWHSVGGANLTGEVRFTEVEPSRTQVDLDLEFEPSGAVEKIGSAVGAVKMEQVADLHDFKEFIESRTDATGAWRGDVSGARSTGERPGAQDDPPATFL